jgi:hypothetical protein
VAGPDVLQALVLDQLQRDVEAEEQRHGRRERARALGLALGRLAPVEVVAAATLGVGSGERALGDRRERQAGRRHQRLLRAGDDDVDAPRVLLEPRGAEAGDGVDDEDRVVAAHDLGDRLDVVDDARGRLAERREHDLDARVLGQQTIEVGGVEADAPARLMLDQVGPVGLAELDPALAELARRRCERLGARADEVRHRRLHRTRPARGEREHRVLGLEHVRQPAEHAGVELVEGGGPVVEHRGGHRLGYGGRHRGRAGRHEVLLDERIRGHELGRVEVRRSGEA